MTANLISSTFRDYVWVNNLKRYPHISDFSAYHPSDDGQQEPDCEECAQHSLSEKYGLYPESE
jgi:hypothetical protein